MNIPMFGDNLNPKLSFFCEKQSLWQLERLMFRQTHFKSVIWRFPKMGGTPKSSNLYTYSFHYFSLTIKLLGYPHDYGNLPILSFGWWFGTFFYFP
jgi:uncharacterized membrane protein YbaN (DUF454 family)